MPSIIDLTGLPISDRTDPRLVANTRSGGVSLAGTEQIVSPLSSVWKWRIILPINTVARARSWRSINAQLDGRYNYIRARACDRYRIGRNDVGASGGPVTYGDGAYHSDDTPFALAQPNAPILAAAERGATAVTVSGTEFDGAMSAGLFFSINDYLHVVTGWEEDGGEIALTFKPGLREAVEEGDEANFDARSVWTLDSDDEGRMDLRLGRFGAVELNLTEAIGRAI